MNLQPVVLDRSPLSIPLRRPLRNALLLLSVLAWMAGEAAPARAENLRLQVQLIWGTDGVKPEGVHCQELDAALRKRLSRIFKWKHYYEIRRRQINVPPKRVKRLEMSKQCLLKFSLPEKRVVEVKLIGEGRLTKTMRQPVKGLRNGELLVLAGETKDNINDAWFVVISVPPKPKPPVPPKPKPASAGAK